MWELTFPRTIVTGEGALEYLKTVEGKRALIVTDKVIHNLDFVEKVVNYLKEAGLEVNFFDDVEPEPSIETIVKGAEFAKKCGPDWFIGLGGGSSMDAAKAIWVLYERPDMEVAAINPLEKLGLRKKARLICIPTTSGTGADVTWATVITDKKEHKKLENSSREIVADIVILDPELTLNLPPRLTAGTGLDALAHAVEAYVSQYRNDFSDAMAIKAIQNIFDYLPRAYKDGKDKEAREKVHNAATMAGLAISNSMHGLGHSLGHPIGALFNIPHSEIIGVVLPYTIEYNAMNAEDRYAEIARAIGIEAETSKEATENLVKAIRDLIREIDVPASVGEMGISWEEYQQKLDDLVKQGSNYVTSFTSPRSPSSEEYRKLFVYAFKGKKIDF